MNDREFNMWDIEDMCQRYDKKYGSYPKNELEGKAVYQFICELNGNDPEKVKAYIEEEWKKAEIGS